MKATTALIRQVHDAYNRTFCFHSSTFCYTFSTTCSKFYFLTHFCSKGDQNTLNLFSWIEKKNNEYYAKLPRQLKYIFSFLFSTNSPATQQNITKRYSNSNKTITFLNNFPSIFYFIQQTLSTKYHKEIKKDYLNGLKKKIIKSLLRNEFLKSM